MKKSINWTNTLFFILLPIIATIGTILVCYFTHVSYRTWVLALVMLSLGSLSITAGYHRLFSHQTYRAAWPVQLILVLFGSAAFQGSVLEWATDHRNHHRYTDTEKDPYNIKQGFWHAHMGWLFKLDSSQRNFDNVADLQESALLRWQHRFYLPIAITMGFVFPMAIGALFGEALGGLFIAGALRLCLGHHSTFCINSLCHMVGKTTYSDRISARDNWLTALVTFGEGYHNFHHQFPLDYRNGIRFYQFDPTKWLIKLLSWLKLADNLKTVSPHRIVRHQINMTENNLLTRAKAASTKLHKQVDMLMQPTRERMQATIAKFEQLERQYIALKQNNITSVGNALKECQKQLNDAKHELQQQLRIWGHAVKYCQTLLQAI